MSPGELRFYKVLVLPCLAAIAYLAAVAFGPTIESRLAPARVEQSVEVIIREVDRLCWNWRSMKVRPLAAEDIDVVLIVRGDRMISSVFSAATGMPWRQLGAVSVGPHVQRYCLTLPPHVSSTDAVKIEQTVFYPGLGGLYRFASRIPDVVSPGR